MPLLPTAPVRIQPYFGWRTDDRLLITVRALRARVDSFETSGRWRAFRTMLAQFASHEVAGLPVELEIPLPPSAGGPRRIAGTTDAEGFAHFDIRFDQPWDRGSHTAWETVRLHWRNRHGDQCAEGHVLAPGREAGLAVISDIDDTIVETGITGDFRQVMRNWRRVLLDMPENRLLVPGADVFYNALGGALAETAPDHSETDAVRPATRRPFFYVSSSPWNLFSYLVAYIGGRGLPLGPVLLRDWGLDRATFGSASHGQHKREAIARIIAHYPDLHFALIGDDTQGDLPAFAELVASHPERIRAVFIRTTAGAFSSEETTAKAAIEAAGVPLWLGAAFDTGQEFLASLGLLEDSGAKRLVKAIEETESGTS